MTEVAAERLGFFFDRATRNEEVVESTALMMEVDEVQKKHIGEVIMFFGVSAATLCFAAWTLVGDPHNIKKGGVNSDLHYGFQGQKPRSVLFFEGEEAKKRDVIDWIRSRLACLMAKAGKVSALADERITA